MMEISIIVPVYKIEEIYLKKCLESLHKQKCDNTEFIIVDDGSPDNCGEICDSYALRDKRFNVIHTKNLGVSHARNMGIDSSHGKYVVFVDGDDYIKDTLCNEISKKININAGIDILLFQFEEYINDKFMNRDAMFYPSKEFISLMRQCNVNQRENRLGLKGYRIGSPWGKAIRRQFLIDNNIRFVEGMKKSQDRVFMFDCLEHTDQIAYFNYCGYFYVARESSITHRYNQDIDGIIGQISAEFGKRIEKYPQIYEDAFNELNLELLIEKMMLNLFHKENGRRFFEDVEQLKMYAENERIKKGLSIVNPLEYNLKRRMIIYAIKYKMYFIAGLITKIFYC